MLDAAGNRVAVAGSTGGNHQEKGRFYYYIVTNFKGRTVVIGPKDTDVDANEFGYAKLDTPFQVVPLQTRDRKRATSIIKAQKLDSTGNLGSAIQPARHQLPGIYDDDGNI